MFFRSVAFSLLLLLSSTALAQSTGTLTGQVIDATTGDPLPGVNVVIEALTQGAATDVDGSYTIEDVPEGTHEVSARFVGYGDDQATVDVQAGETTTQNFALGEDLLMLDELVVTGTGGSVERRKLSADVSVLNIRDIEEAPVTSVDQLLQGRVAGASVRMQSAQPGQGALVNLRGITSVFGSQTPVIYIDGVRVDNASGTSLSGGGETTSALAELLTNDVERVEITKGGAASTLYGSDAANGVIQIFTKRGNIGDPTITFRTEQGLDTPVTKFLNDTGFAFGQDEDSPVNDPESDDFGQGNFIADEFLKNGYFQNYYVGVNGGREGLRYNVSGRAQNATGVQPSNENTLYALRGNVQAEVTPNVDVGFSGSYTRNNFSRIYNGTSIADPITSFEVGDAYFFTGASTFEEALEVFLFPEITEGVNRYLFSTSVEYHPSDVFQSKLTAGIDSRDNEQRLFEPAGADPITGNDNGGLTRFDRNYNGVTLEYLGTVSYPREGRVTSDFTFGAQGFREDVSIFTATGETFALPGSEDFDETATIDANETRTEIFNGGIFFKERLGLFERVFLDAGLRLDGNSAFGADVGLQAYPSFGIAYTLSDETFWAETFGDLWSSFKLRGAFGQTGKFPDPFTRDFTIQSTSFRGASAPRFDNPGNPDLRPEKTATLEGGFDASLFRNRLSTSFTYYTSATTDALLFVPEDPATGLGVQLRNAGRIENVGVELSVEAFLLNRRSVTWLVGFNYGWFRNEMTDLGGGAPFNVGGTDAYGAQQRVIAGEPIGVWRAKFPADRNGDALPDTVEYEVTGTTPYPTTTASLNTTLNIGGFTIYALADWALGAQVFDYGSVWSDFNNIPRTETPVRYDLAGNEAGNFNPTANLGAGGLLLKDGDFFKLRELSVRYGLPRPFAARLGLQNLSVFVTARNLLTFTRDPDNLLDPELSGVSATDGDGLELGGQQSITLPAPRQFRLGLEVRL